MPWLAPLLPATGVLPWLLDLASHWQWLYLLLIVAGVLAALRRHRRWALALLALPLPWWSALPRLASGSDGMPLSIAVANVNSPNPDATGLMQWLRGSPPDLVALLEPMPEFTQGLAGIPGYPYRVLHPLPFPGFGVGLLSRWPIVATRVVAGADDIPHLEAEVALGERRMLVFVFHPMPPATPDLHARRDAKLRALAAQAASQGLPSLLLGDLNATPWSSGFKAVQASGWRRAGTLAPTWPSPGQGLFGIPIDHVLASPHWQVSSAHVGRSIGSDHLPVRAQLVLRGLR